MVQGDKAVGAAAGGDEGEEIDRIMKEIEDLEKKMDATAVEDHPVNETSVRASTGANPETETDEFEASAASEAPDSLDTPETHETTGTNSKVVPLRPSVVESLAETDAVPAHDEPLVRAGDSGGDGGLSLKIGGCADVNLEFTRSGMSVSLSCTDDGLVIRTDQGAEFRIPFKRAA